jgi:hypothetical protein
MILPMISTRSQFLRRSIGMVALAAALVGYFAATTPAAARIWIGFGLPGLYVGPPAYYPPPVYYPPPAYYPPPMSYAPAYAPPQTAYPPQQESAAPAGGGQACYAGAYTCPMDQPMASGAACYCLGNGGTRVWGRAN